MPIVTCREQERLIAEGQQPSDLLYTGQVTWWTEVQIAAHAISQDTRQVPYTPTVVIDDPTPLRPTLDVNLEQFLPAIHNHASITNLPARKAVAVRSECLLQVQCNPFQHVLSDVSPPPACPVMQDGHTYR
jgi:hypothetical protein